jgi:methionyl-tRNA formyltransferase
VRLIFAGTPEFAAQALIALHDAGHDIALVLTQPDRPAGRGQKLGVGAVKQAAQVRGLALYQPASLKDPEAHTPLAEARADVMVVAAYGLILPQAVLDIPPRGCLNIHASLLPRWRGAAPIQRAILAGDAQTGVGIMLMEAGLDTGPVLLEVATPIGATETAGELHDRLAGLGASAIVAALDQLDTLAATAQDNARATYAAKLTRDEARLDWSRPSAELARAVRAYNPAPGAFTLLDGRTLKLWRALRADNLAPGAGEPGTVLSADRHGLSVATGDGALRILELQAEGGRRMEAGALLAGRPIAPGTRLGP